MPDTIQHSVDYVKAVLLRAENGGFPHNRGMGRPTKSAHDRPLWSKRLEAVRTLTGMDQRSFAELLGLQAETYRRYERGETEPNFKTLAKLRAETGASLDLIITGYPQNDLNMLSPESRKKIGAKP